MFSLQKEILKDSHYEVPQMAAAFNIITQEYKETDASEVIA